MINTESGQTKVRRMHLGKEADHTGYEAEIVGLLLALHQASQIPQRCPVSIYSDNQGGLKVINTPPEGPAGYLVQELVTLMTALRERRPVFAKTIAFRWISAHSGVQGNEKADEEAKKAAAGRST
jgi:ribonuclease HI